MNRDWAFHKEVQGDEWMSLENVRLLDEFLSLFRWPIRPADEDYNVRPGASKHLAQAIIFVQQMVPSFLEGYLLPRNSCTCP